MRTLTKLILTAIILFGFSDFALAEGEDAIPSYYEEAGVSRTREYTGQHAKETIDPHTGKLQWHDVDLFIPGNGGFDLKVQRSYNSKNSTGTLSNPVYIEPTMVGVGWTMHFGRVMRKWIAGSLCDNSLWYSNTARNPVLELPDGQRRVFYASGAGWLTTDFWWAECGAGGGMDVFSPEGTKYEMTFFGMQTGSVLQPDNTVYVTKITDRNGNWMNISYATNNVNTYITGVTTSDGRSLTYNYDAAVIDPNTNQQTSPASLKNITDGARTWTYVYSPGPNGGTSHVYLKEVIRPDGSKWKYEYNEVTPANGAGTYNLRQVTYPQGGTIDYTYNLVTFTPAFNGSLPPSVVSLK